VEAGQALRRLRLAQGWSQEEVAARMAAYGYDFHQTMIAKIEAAQRPLRVRELADFAALYGVKVQDLINPPETDREIADATAQRDVAKVRAAQAHQQLQAARQAVQHAEDAYQASAAEAADLEERLASLLKSKVTSIAPATGSPTVLRILLGAQLRRLRQAKRITLEDAGKAIGASSSKFSRLETGRVDFKDRDVTDLLTLYGVTDEEERDALRALARRANAPGWWHDYSDVLPPYFEAYVALEEAATQIRAYEVQFIPGLLQTEDYARAVTVLGHHNAPARAIERRVRLRMTRQAVLDREEPPNVWAVIDEAVLRRPAGSPAIMRGQLQHLADLAKRPNVTIQIIPFETGGHAFAGGPFSILRFVEPDLPDVVYLEHLTEALYLDKPETVDSYLRVMERICMEAATPADSAAIIAALLHET
jgi:transcriptional regulator with XRE-family HTH domain